MKGEGEEAEEGGLEEREAKDKEGGGQEEDRVRGREKE